MVNILPVKLVCYDVKDFTLFNGNLSYSVLKDVVVNSVLNKMERVKSVYGGIFITRI
jgi:hypothetical protein